MLNSFLSVKVFLLKSWLRQTLGWRHNWWWDGWQLCTTYQTSYQVVVIGCKEITWLAREKYSNPVIQFSIMIWIESKRVKLSPLLLKPFRNSEAEYCHFGTQEVDKTKPTAISSLSLKHQNFLHIKTLETLRTILFKYWSQDRRRWYEGSWEWSSEIFLRFLIENIWMLGVWVILPDIIPTCWACIRTVLMLSESQSRTILVIPASLISFKSDLKTEMILRGWIISQWLPSWSR